VRVSQKIFVHQFPSGLTLVAEEMDWLESAAFALLTPAGCSFEPSELGGLGNLTCEMAQRGAGSRDSRQLVSDLENLGADCSSSVTNSHTSFGGAMPAESLFDVLSIYADIIRRPHFPEDQIEDARLACLQEVRSLEDDLAQKLFVEMRRRVYGEPLGRSPQGTLESVSSLKLDHVKEHFKRGYQPRGAILSVAGKISWPALKDHVEKILGNWKEQPPHVVNVKSPERTYLHMPVESSQTHIGISFDAVPYSHPDYFQLRGAVGVLSDGMSSRLFTEVRERRGLCYTVYASCHSLRDRGAVFAYAGTTAERAQETLDVMLEQLRDLRKGVRAEELARLKGRIKRSLIIQQESSPARSGSIAFDWYFLNHIRTKDELSKIIDDLSVDTINAYLEKSSPEAFTVVTLGPSELKVAE
jgi:predicted Zn-dependent peptidase